MKKANQHRTLAGLLLVFFLSTSVLSVCYHSLELKHASSEWTLSKQHTGTSKSPAQLLFEEKEGEGRSKDGTAGNDVHSNLFFIYQIAEPPGPSMAGWRYAELYIAPRACGNATGIPTYLAKRTLVI